MQTKILEKNCSKRLYSLGWAPDNFGATAVDKANRSSTFSYYLRRLRRTCMQMSLLKLKERWMKLGTDGNYTDTRVSKLLRSQSTKQHEDLIRWSYTTGAHSDKKISSLKSGIMDNMFKSFMKVRWLIGGRPQCSSGYRACQWTQGSRV
jgi:hypothetical protein